MVKAATITFSPAGTQTVLLGGQVSNEVVVSGLVTGVAPSVETFDINVDFDPLLLSLATVTFGDQLDVLGLGFSNSQRLASAR